jgi:hypothetical protein
LRTSQGYIFFILQHLATNLCSFTHSKKLFLAVVQPRTQDITFAHPLLRNISAGNTLGTRWLAVVLDFVFLALIKI